MEYIKDLGEKFENLITELKDELSTVRTNRPTPKLIEDIRAEYAEQQLAIKQLGSISVELPKNLLVAPWDQGALNSIAKAIDSANIGVAAAVQGNIVRVSLPELTNERRQELVRLVKDMAEKIRIKMRTLRDEVHKRVNQEKDEDEKFRGKENLQELVDSFNKEVDALVDSKINEVMN